MDSQKPHFFVALYTGRTIAQAQIVAASTDADLVEFALQRMLPEQEPQSSQERTTDGLATERLSALRLIRGDKEVTPE